MSAPYAELDIDAVLVNVTIPRLADALIKEATALLLQVIPGVAGIPTGEHHDR